MADLGSFPVDDMTLDLLEQALEGTLVMADDEEPTGSCVGRFLDFMSGYDPAKVVEIDSVFSEYPDPTYHEHDVIRALIAEVRTLREALESVGGDE